VATYPAVKRTGRSASAVRLSGRKILVLGEVAAGDCAEVIPRL
jgi:hypothetical protein